MTDSSSTRQRLHPLTPVLRGANLTAIAIAAISWQGYQDLGFQRWLLAVAGVMVLVLAGSAVSWLVTGYEVVGRELRVYEGLFYRRTRAIPLERLQTVELVRPVRARLFGLAELRLEVVGASKTEAPLAFLSLADAIALRERLLRLTGRFADLALTDTGDTADTGDTGGTAATTDTAGQPEAAAPAAARTSGRERIVHTVVNRDLVVSQLLRPQWWALPLAIAAPIYFFFYENQLSTIAIASMLTAIIGAIQAPVRALLADWRFTIAIASDGLRLRRGLLETRSQTVPPGRVQAVAVEWPLLWRGHGWVRASMEIAGVAATQNRGVVTGTLLPVGSVPVAQQVVSEALPGFVLTEVAIHPVPGRAGWVAPIRRFVLGYQLTDTAFVSRDGPLTRRLTIVPYGRIQSIRIWQGPVQRLLRLASVYADSAEGMQAVALHRDIRQAQAIAAELIERSTAARSQPDVGFMGAGRRSDMGGGT